MTNTDDRLTNPAPAPPPPSYIRRHPILAGFAVLSGLSLFSALWPVSAIVITLAVAGHATGLDRAAWSLAERGAARVRAALRDHAPSAPSPSPTTPEPAAPPYRRPTAKRTRRLPPRFALPGDLPRRRPLHTGPPLRGIREHPSLAWEPESTVRASKHPTVRRRC